MRKWLCAFLLILQILGISEMERTEPPSVSARCAVLMREGGEILFSQNENKRALIASTTKLMTAMVAIEDLDLNREVTIAPACCGVEGSSMLLKPGERYTVRQLLEGLLLVSGNDAALALAQANGGQERFVIRMNDLARALSLRNTHFDNPHGLDAEGQYSTAADLACLMDYCMRNPCFAELIDERSTVVHGYDYVNHNKLLTRCEGCIGGKTGYTVAAGRCLVSCCERMGIRMICVTLNDPDDWNDHMELYDWAYGQIAEHNKEKALPAWKRGMRI